jgi:phage gp37-like protein
VDFEDVEDAIKTAIETDLTYVKTVETYAGQLEGEIEKLTIPFPAVFVSYAGSAFDWVDGQNFNDAPVFSVIVAAKDLRGNADLRKGPNGCYQMIKDVLTSVANQRFGLTAMQPMKPVKVSLIFISKTMAAYGIDFGTDFDTDFSG